MNRRLAPFAILLLGIILSIGVSTYGGLLSSPKQEAKAQVSQQWLDATGAGIAIPACGSSSITNPTCDGTTPNITFNWAWAGGNNGALHDTSRGVDVFIVPDGGSFPVPNNPDPCPGGNYTYCDSEGNNSDGNGSWTWTGGVSGQSYDYRIDFLRDRSPRAVSTGVPGSVSGSFDLPNCSLPLPAPGPLPVCNGGVDIGLRVNDGTGIIRVAAEPAGIVTSPLRIFAQGRVNGIVLIDPGDANASLYRIRIPDGSIKTFCRLP